MGNYETVLLDIDKIEIDDEPAEERKPSDKIDRLLAASIRSEGLHTPIEVRPHPEKPDYWKIIAGRGRIRSFRLLGKTEIPAFVRSVDDALAEAIKYSENVCRNPVTKDQFYLIIPRLQKLWEEMNAREKAAREAAAAAAPTPEVAPEAAPETNGELHDAEATNGEAVAVAAEPVAEAKAAAPKAGGKGKKAKAEGPREAHNKGKGFLSLVKSITGETGRTAQRSIAIAKAIELLTPEEQKLVLPDDVAKHPKKGELEAWATLPEDMRAPAVKLVASGMTWAKAVAAQVKQARANGVKPKSEDDLNDVEWLTTYCATVLARVKKPEPLQSDCLQYRRWAKQRKKLQKAANDHLADAKADPKVKMGPYQGIILRAFRAKHPNDWQACSTCSGLGVKPAQADHPQPEACVSCNGAGYKVTSEPL